MNWDLHKIDVLIISVVILVKIFVGFLNGMVIPIFPTLVATNFNDSLNIGSTLNSAFLERANSTFNYQQLSILFAIKNVFQIFITPFMGYFCEIFGSTKIILFGTVLTTSTLTIYGLGNKYYVLILGRISESIASCSINCAVSAFTAHYYKDNKKRGFVYGITGLGLAIGSSLGPAYGGLMFQYYGKVVAFLSVLPFNILQIILIIWLLIYFRLQGNRHSENLKRSEIIEIEPDITLNDVSKSENIILTTESINDTSENCKVEESLLNIKNEETTKVSSSHVSLSKETHNILNFFTDPYFMILIISLFVMFWGIFIYIATVSHYMRLTFGSTETQQGLIWILTLVGHILGFFVGNVINHKFSKIRHIVLMIVIYMNALGSLCMALMPTWWSLAIPLCFIVNQQMVYIVVFSPLIAKIVEKRHQSKFGLMAAIIWTVLAIVTTIGSYIGPILISQIGFLYLNVILLLLGLIYGPLLLLLKKFV